ncbi:hypothetical protein [Actinophytocola xanthii]|uniref:hypothetical protein n=1 Tax=Actinophytocola xanthii TaxID=1912961 RepID=UPI000946FB94|nr:hypothetical protein [Actinophytocola xanthii]
MRRRRTRLVATVLCTTVTGGVLAGTGSAAAATSYELTVVMLGRDGAPAADNDLFVADYENGTTTTVSEPSGTARVELPGGDYLLQSAVHAGERTDRLTRPWLRLNGDTTVVLDARTTRPVDVTVERPDARLVQGMVGASMLTGKGTVRVPVVLFDDFADVGTGQTGPDAPADRFVGSAQFTLAVPDADGAVTDSPYSYSLAWFTPGRAYTGTRRVRDAELATVHTVNRPQEDERSGGKFAVATYTRLPNVSTLAPSLPVRLPGVRTELFTTRDTSWQLELSPQTTPSPDPPRWWQTVLARAYRAGHRYREVWNGGGVFGPALPGPESLVEWAVAYPGALGVRVPLYSAGADVWGSSAVDRAHTVGYRDGQPVCESDRPAECFVEGTPPAGDYRLRTEAIRGHTDLSTRISAEWAFRHAGPVPGRTTPLPLQVVRFDAGLDEANTAPGGRLHPVTVTVQRNPGSVRAGVRSLTVDASFDDGASWQRAPVTLSGDSGLVVLRHPPTGHVSLRARAVDTAGNSVDQTIVRAYRLR